MSKTFVKLVADITKRTDSRIVLALDPPINPYALKNPEERLRERLNTAARIKNLLAELDGLVSGVKIGLPLIFGLGLDLVEEIISTHRKSYFFICDPKMADIGHINRLEAAQLFDVGFDALIIHAAVGIKGGIDEVVSLAEEMDKGVLGLCAMSHPGAGEHLNKHYNELLEIAAKAGVDGFVVPATYPHLITSTKNAYPSTIIFSPGVGTQGASFGSALAAGADYEIIGRSIVQDPFPAVRAREILKEIKETGIDVQKIALALAKHRCVMVGEFKLTSGLMSPYYIDLRATPSHQDLFDLITSAYVAELKSRGISFDRIAGVATAGVPIGALVAYKLNKPFLYIRREERTHGTKSLIEGVINPGESILIVDDAVTTGGSLLKAIEAIQERGGRVEYAMVLVDREQGGAQNLAKKGVKLISLMTASRLIQELYLKGFISREDYERVIKYIQESKNIQS
ncbi:MAG: orotate phosphoribosyltransferase [Candidatus Hadarchaeum sp.]|uniref:orotate phosphoribosyltransferase n=1 Tax=Candidatus Hadarchaeum sp. TaxID=2883567 RepID=UPI003D0B145D